MSSAQDKRCGSLRFASAALASAALSKFEAKPEGERIIAGLPGTLRLISGEEEVAYHRKRVGGF